LRTQQFHEVRKENRHADKGKERTREEARVREGKKEEEI